MGEQLKSKKKKTYIKIIVLVVLCAVLIAGGAGYFLFRVESIEYTGNKHYDEEELTECIFGSGTPNALLYTLFGNKDKEIPFVQRYDVEVQWPNKLSVTVYEKAVIGYISYMGCNMYFDKDGMVVESSSEFYEGVPEIAGLVFQSIVLDSKLDIGNDAVYRQILEMTQSFKKYELDIRKVYFNADYEATLYMGDVKVILGDTEDCMDKLYALKQMSEKLTGMKGTLYLDNYNGSESSVIFKKEN